VLIGIDLLAQKRDRRARALQEAVVIHASDTLAAVLASKTGKLPPPMDRVIVVISAINTALALYASR
jgi:hypothetical protein